MNLKEVKELVAEILRSDISEFELEHTGTRIRLRRGFRTGDPAGTAVVESRSPAAPPPPRALVSAVAETSPPLRTAEEGGPESSEVGIHIVTSPIVGTFYRAPSPGAEPYIKIGDQAEEGTILCVVEAMKLMNEIPSDVSGEVVRIFVENSYPVEFGQKLFGIRPRK